MSPTSFVNLINGAEMETFASYKKSEIGPKIQSWLL